MEILVDDVRQCRVCLAESSVTHTNGFVDLLDQISSKESSADQATKETTYLYCFNECTRLELIEEDLAKYKWHFLCGACIKELQLAYKFIVKARLSDEVLKKRMRQFKEEPLEEEVEFKREDEHECNKEWGSFEYLQDNIIHETIEEDIEEGDMDHSDMATSSADVEYEVVNMFVDDTDKENLNSSGVELSNDAEFKIEFINDDCEEQDEDENKTAKEVTEDTSIVVKVLDSGSKNELEEPSQYLQFKCELCTAKYDFQRDLIHHYEMDHDDKLLHFTCDLCDSRFVTKNTLRIHKRQIHENCEYLDCQQCGRTVLKSFYNMHFKRHNTKLQFLCSKCPNIFSSKYTLNNHMKRHLDKRDRNFKCTRCERKFFTVENLQLHQVVHKDPEERETYKCSLCPKSFYRQSNLKLHMQMHRGETVDCPHCAKKFVRRRDLEIHIRFHTGNYPFECTLCSKRFAIKSHLTYHQKRHMGIKYKCSRCDKMFLNLSGLKEHSYEHTGMPLVCNICMRGFPTKFKMRRHIRSMHVQIFENGYTDALAEQYITQHEVTRLDAKRSHTDEVMVESNTMEKVEMLEEYEKDITKDMLLM